MTSTPLFLLLTAPCHLQSHHDPGASFFCNVSANIFKNSVSFFLYPLPGKLNFAHLRLLAFCSPTHGALNATYEVDATTNLASVIPHSHQICLQTCVPQVSSSPTLSMAFELFLLTLPLPVCQDGTDLPPPNTKRMLLCEISQLLPFLPAPCPHMSLLAPL